MRTVALADLETRSRVSFWGIPNGAKLSVSLNFTQKIRVEPELAVKETLCGSKQANILASVLFGRSEVSLKKVIELGKELGETGIEEGLLMPGMMKILQALDTENKFEYELTTGQEWSMERIRGIIELGGVIVVGVWEMGDETDLYSDAEEHIVSIVGYSGEKVVVMDSSLAKGEAMGFYSIKFEDFQRNWRWTIGEDGDKKIVDGIVIDKNGWEDCPSVVVKPMKQLV